MIFNLGESGAGKTEAMKICLTYIGEVSQAKGGASPTRWRSG